MLRTTNSYLRKLPAVAAISAAGFLCLAADMAAAVDITNQRDPNYLRAVERLNEARQAMATAMALVRESRRIYRIPELDYERLLGDLGAVSSQLDSALLPESRRQKHRVLYPDSIYFLPKEAQQ